MPKHASKVPTHNTPPNSMISQYLNIWHYKVPTYNTCITSSETISNDIKTWHQNRSKRDIPNIDTFRHQKITLKKRQFCYLWAYVVSACGDISIFDHKKWTSAKPLNYVSKSASQTAPKLTPKWTPLFHDIDTIYPNITKMTISGYPISRHHGPLERRLNPLDPRLNPLDPRLNRTP